MPEAEGGKSLCKKFILGLKKSNGFNFFALQIMA